MLDRSYYQLRKYLAANFKCDLGCPTIKIALEALDACNFIAAYGEIGKMISGKVLNAVVTNMVVQNDPVMDIKLRACKSVLSLAEADPKVMAYALEKNLDFACCSRSSYGDCLIGLFANIVPADYDNTVLEQIVRLSKAIYRTDYDLERMREDFPEDVYFMEKCIEKHIERHRKEEEKEESKKDKREDMKELTEEKDNMAWTYHGAYAQGFLERVQKDAGILENEWIF